MDSDLIDLIFQLSKTQYVHYVIVHRDAYKIDFPRSSYKKAKLKVALSKTASYFYVFCSSSPLHHSFEDIQFTVTSLHSKKTRG